MSSRQKVTKVYSCYGEGIGAVISEIEVSITPGIPTFDVIGLCDSSIRESKWRIKSALVASEFKMPQGHITVSISPAYMRKSGSSFDLPIALGILFASGQLNKQTDTKVYAEGELSLTGTINGTPGSMVRLKAAAKENFDVVLFPESEIDSAKCNSIKGMTIDDLIRASKIFNQSEYHPENYVVPDFDEKENDIDFSFLKGQEKAKRALVIAAAGKHSILLLGSPGCGKTTAGRIINSILPPMMTEEMCDVYALADAISDVSSISEIARPLRTIHPGSTVNQLLGNTRTLLPGEIALANHGVLFADEICEYRNELIDTLRIPLEEHEVKLTKDGNTYSYPASFVFVGAGNPCRCGMLYEPGSKCKCTRQMRKRYLSKLSGPFIDRIDLFTEMRSIGQMDMRDLAGRNTTNETDIVRQKISVAWSMQRERFKELGSIAFNGTISGRNVAEFIRAPEDVVETAITLSQKYGYSGRGFERILRVGRTIADLDERTDMQVSDVYEAVVYRNNFKEE